MIFVPTTIPDTYVIELEPLGDERGFFARSWCQNDFVSRGLNGQCVQCNVSYSARRGTLRGLHYQVAPHEEAKLVRVVRGAVHDVVLDLRPHSPTFRSWYATQLTAANRRTLYVPEGCAHGFITLSDDTEIHYQMSESYHPESSRGVRWDDPCVRGAWPFRPTVVSPRDQGYREVA